MWVKSLIALCGALQKILARHHVELRLAANMPMIELDPVLFEQVLFNVLDNAAKYALPGTTICIETSREADSVCIRIFDEGKDSRGRSRTGIRQVLPCEKGDRVRAGTGLGLAISRGFVEALNGTIVGGKPLRPLRRGLHYTPSEVGQCAPAAIRSRDGRRPHQSSCRRRRAADPQAPANGFDVAGL